MRLIKFRGKDSFSGQWRYGAYIPTEFTEWREPSIFDGHHRTEVDGETLGQYTGYKDADGKEIYEGDILILYDSTGVRSSLIVCYGEYEGFQYGGENFGFYISFTRKKLNAINRQDFLHWLRQGVKVIGNIYDNPKMLEEIQ